MANNSDYTITTLSNNLNQRNKPVFSQAGNNTITLRDKCSPYTLIASPEGDINRDIKKFPFGCLTTEAITTTPAAKYEFEENAEAGPVYDGSGNDLSGTLTCSYYDGGLHPQTSCTLPWYDTDALYGSYSMHLSGNNVAQAGNYLQMQSLGHAEGAGWLFLTGSWALSMWFKPNAGFSTQGLCGMFGLTHRPLGGGVPAGGNHNLYRSFGVGLGYQSAYHLAGAINLTTDGGTGSFRYSYWNCALGTTGDCGGVRAPYWTVSQWNHLFFQVSGSEGEGDRFCQCYINGQKLPAMYNPSYQTYPTNSAGEFFWNATASLSTDQHVRIGPNAPNDAYGSAKFSGSIDQIGLWSHYFTADQVTQIYQSSGSLFDVITGYKTTRDIS